MRGPACGRQALRVHSFRRMIEYRATAGSGLRGCACAGSPPCGGFKMMDPKKPPFDFKRMTVGGFKVLVGG